MTSIFSVTNPPPKDFSQWWLESGEVLTIPEKRQMTIHSMMKIEACAELQIETRGQLAVRA